MRLALVAVGRLRPCYRTAADDYLRRLRRFATVTEHEVREAVRAPTPTRQRAEEADRLTRAIPRDSRVVVLARADRGWSSRETARRLGRWREEARPVAFVLGGSTGLDTGLVARADARWSLGPLTLPHELARVVVLEQLYRGWSILAGQPYHKGA